MTKGKCERCGQEYETWGEEARMCWTCRFVEARALLRRSNRQDEPLTEEGARSRRELDRIIGRWRKEQEEWKSEFDLAIERGKRQAEQWKAEIEEMKRNAERITAGAKQTPDILLSTGGICPACHGTGLSNMPKPLPSWQCKFCGGTGRRYPHRLL